MRSPAALIVGILAVAGTAGAQAVRGVTVTPDSVPVPGVIVTLFDTNGRAVARALSDDIGRFAMRAPAAGTYYVEAKRLAFRPTHDVSIALEDAKTLLHTLVLTGAPVRLAEVRVTAEQQCRVDADSGSAAWALWEEARKALLSSQLTRLTRAYHVDVTTFVRRQAGGAELAQTDSTPQYDMPIRPFASSRPAEELAEHGYVTRRNLDEVYHAPDEDVLLSESFATTHCLRMLPDSVDGSARLGFAPVPGRRQADITGVLTIDRATSELRRLDFSFTNLPPRDVTGSPGGAILFRRLPEGSWLIDEWAIWLPVAEVRQVAGFEAPRSSTLRPARRDAPPVTTRGTGVQTTGGQVTRVIFGDATVWSRTPASQQP